ncbi:MAG: GTPase HflX [Methanobacteriota archaeon]|nr:MAG: GTPase HflX [Euryarchaeota archaeon]
MAKNAVLLSITVDIDEISALLRTLDIDIVREVVQKRTFPHRAMYLGPGRIEEIIEDIADTRIDLVVVNGILKPSQHHALETQFGRECADRVGIILKIFAEHAHTDEAKRQVTLATLKYELPFLREWIHKAKSGERPGFLSGGAYATEVYYEHARSHIHRIEEELKRRTEQRELRRRRRRNAGFFLASLAGYTNAGKSAILNALCDTSVEVDGRLFSTLSTTTRKLEWSAKRVLITDTVGFIKDLPLELVNAFNATLEEVFLADMILLVVDVSEPMSIIERKLKASDAILTPRLQGQTVVVVGSKADRLSESKVEEVRIELESRAGPRRVVLTSAKTLSGLDQLVQAIDHTYGNTNLIRATLPQTDEAYSLISSLYDIADVQQNSLTNNIQIVVTCKEGDYARIHARIKAVGGIIEAANRRQCEDDAP